MSRSDHSIGLSLLWDGMGRDQVPPSTVEPQLEPYQMVYSIDYAPPPP